MEETFLFLQKLLKQAASIPLSRHTCDRNALLDFFRAQTNYFFDNAYLEHSPLLHQLYHLPLRTDTAYEWAAPGGITFLLYADPEADCCIALGPVLTKPFSREEAIRQLTPFSCRPQQLAEFLRFCAALPVVDRQKLYGTGVLTIARLTGNDQTLQFVQVDLPTPEPTPDHAAFSQGEDIIQMRQVETRYEHSAALTDAISQGNLSLAMHIMGNFDPGTQTPVRNANPLRNAQNYCIVLNTQLRHALEKTGIHPYQVDRLSNEIGLEIEQLKSTKQLPQFFRQVLTRYCRLVQEHTYPKLKPLTHLAVTYIKEHLADNLTVRDTAKALTVNANYLSAIFHRDMGVTFIDFVNRERTRQAAALLKHTNLQIQQIASAVGYNNTSYFAKQFLRFYGISPSQYRQ